MARGSINWAPGTLGFVTVRWRNVHLQRNSGEDAISHGDASITSDLHPVPQFSLFLKHTTRPTMAPFSASSFKQLDVRRFRTYILRLPLATRLLFGVATAFVIADLALPWFSQWASLTPKDVNLTAGSTSRLPYLTLPYQSGRHADTHTVYRLNTFLFLHLHFFHYLFNMLALVPLLERFEAEWGTLVTFLLFTGPFATIPGGVYVLIERFVFRGNVSIQGASLWVFLLLAYEAMKTYKSDPYFEIASVKIPTWTTPLILNLFVTFLIPRSSFTGHLCGLAVGYLWGTGYIRFLVPSEKILRWIENKLNLLGRIPHYVSVDQKVYGRYGVLPSTSTPRPPILGNGTSPVTFTGGSQRLGS